MKLLKKLLKYKYYFLSFLLLFPLYIFLYKIIIPKTNSFGCFDDCFNYVGGYFILKGKHLYSDIYFNHQFIPAYLSFFIQTITHPQSIYELLLRHRQFILLLGLLFNIIFILRFGPRFIFFSLLFESSKYYLFGTRFLGETIAVYPLIYLAGIAFEKIRKEKIYKTDYILAPLFAWFVIFSREPYSIAVIFILGFFLWGKFKKIKLISILIFLFLTFTGIFYHNFSDYYFNLITVNTSSVLGSELRNNQVFGIGGIKGFFYPLSLLLPGNWNLFKELLLGIDLVFLGGFFVLLKQKRAKLALLIFLILGLVNLRSGIPGRIYFEAFNDLVWFGVFVFSTVYLLEIFKNKKIFIYIFLAFLFAFFIFSRENFRFEKTDPQTELLTNYGELLQYGEVVKILSYPKDTLFVDGGDDLVYFQSDRISPYKYSWYTSYMQSFSKFSNERLNMFRTNPPDFYKEYGSCPKKTEITGYSLPDFAKKEYERFYSEGKPTCLFVSKKKLKTITPEQFETAKKWLFELKPKDNPI